MLILTIVIAAVLGLLVGVGIKTRDDDKDAVSRQFAAQNCGVISRQVAGLTIQLETANLFAWRDRSPAIRAYHRRLLPIRERQLIAARADEKRAGCLSKVGDQ